MPRIGRPAKPPVPGARIHHGLRITAELKARLDQAARGSGRSLSHESEYRLERSFADEGLFASPEMKRWAITLAHQFATAGETAARHAGIDAASWMQDPDCLLQATSAALGQLLRDLERAGTDPHVIGRWLRQMAETVDFRHAAASSRKEGAR